MVVNASPPLTKGLHIFAFFSKKLNIQSNLWNCSVMSTIASYSSFVETSWVSIHNEPKVVVCWSSLSSIFCLKLPWVCLSMCHCSYQCVVFKSHPQHGHQSINAPTKVDGEIGHTTKLGIDMHTCTHTLLTRVFGFKGSLLLLQNLLKGFRCNLS